MPRRIGAREAHELIDRDGYALLDVRSVAEFEAGHPAGAFNIPWVFVTATGRAPNDDFAAVVSRHFAKDAKVILSCQSGNRSLHALCALEALGFTGLVDQRAGWGGVRDPFGRLSEQGWQGEGLPSATGDGGPLSYASLSGS